MSTGLASKATLDSWTREQRGEYYNGLTKEQRVGLIRRFRLDFQAAHEREMLYDVGTEDEWMARLPEANCCGGIDKIRAKVVVQHLREVGFLGFLDNFESICRMSN